MTLAEFARFIGDLQTPLEQGTSSGDSSMGTIRVAINGFGTIGKRVADAVDAQSDMEVAGVTKTGPSFGCELAAKKGFPLYCTSVSE